MSSKGCAVQCFCLRFAIHWRYSVFFGLWFCGISIDNVWTKMFVLHTLYIVCFCGVNAAWKVQCKGEGKRENWRRLQRCKEDVYSCPTTGVFPLAAVSVEEDGNQGGERYPRSSLLSASLFPVCIAFRVEQGARFGLAFRYQSDPLCSDGAQTTFLASLSSIHVGALTLSGFGIFLKNLK